MRGYWVGLALIAALALGAAERAAAQCGSAPVCEGDILVTDITLNEVYRLRCPSTPCTRTTLSSGQNLDSPRGVIAGPTGLIFVTESGNADALIRIDPTLPSVTANQVRISAGGNFSSPRGVAFAPNGDFLVAEPNDDIIYRVHPVSGAQSVFSSGSGAEESFHFPSDIARETDGGLLVTDAPGPLPPVPPETEPQPQPQQVLRVNPAGGFPLVIANDLLLRFPRGVAIEANGNAVVADTGTTGPPVVPSRLIRIDRSSGLPQTQSVVPVTGGLQSPRGVAVDASGNLIVADFNAKAVYRVHPTNGARTTLTSGATLGPWGVAVVGPVSAPVKRDVLVADAGPNVRTIVRVTPAGAATPLAPTGPLGAPVAVTKTRTASVWSGKVLVADGGVVRAIDAAQNVTLVASGAPLSNVTGIVVDATNDLLVTDDVANAVIRIKPDGSKSFVGTPGGELASPVALVIDRDGLLVVAVRYTDSLTGPRAPAAHQSGDGRAPRDQRRRVAAHDPRAHARRQRRRAADRRRALRDAGADGVGFHPPARRAGRRPERRLPVDDRRAGRLLGRRRRRERRRDLRERSDRRLGAGSPGAAPLRSARAEHAAADPGHRRHVRAGARHRARRRAHRLRGRRSRRRPDRKQRRQL